MSQPGESRVLRLDAEDIPRLIYLARVLRLCVFPVGTVLLGDIVLLFVPQAREALRAFGDGSRFVSQIIALWVAYVLWMLSAWYVARLLLGRRFQPDLVGICSSPAFAQKVALWLPRLLALFAALPVPINLLRDPELRLTGVLLILTGCLVLLGLVFRRQWAQSHKDEWVAQWQAKGPESIERFEQLSGGAWAFITALFRPLVRITDSSPPGYGDHCATHRIAGPPPLRADVMGDLWWPRAHLSAEVPGLPQITWLLIVVVVVFARWNENRYVARGTGAENVPRKPSQRFRGLARAPTQSAGTGHLHCGRRRRLESRILDDLVARTPRGRVPVSCLSPIDEYLSDQRGLGWKCRRGDLRYSGRPRPPHGSQLSLLPQRSPPWGCIHGS